MIISLGENCPIFAGDARMALHRLLQSVYRRQNLIASPGPERLQQLLGPESWDTYGEILSQSYKRLVNSRQAWSRHSECGECGASRIADYYTLPTILVVENAQSDGSWITLVARLLRPELAEMLSGSSTPANLYNGGGIDEMPRQIKGLARERKRFRLWPTQSLKVVAICDSDSKYPGHMPASAARIAEVAASEDVVSHILAKRTIENYVPDGALQEYVAKHRDVAPAFTRLQSLSREQRDFYPMKHGFATGDTDGTEGLFDERFEDRLGLGDFISTFLSEYSYHVERRELIARDGKNELDQLLDIIESNL